MTPSRRQQRAMRAVLRALATTPARHVLLRRIAERVAECGATTETRCDRVLDLRIKARQPTRQERIP